jgi:hypothetical protein
MSRISDVKKEQYKSKMLVILSKHIGKNNPIRMADLYKEMFGKEPKDNIQTTRIIRTSVESLRREGVPVCSSMHKNNGGYYLANTGSELEDYLNRLRKRAIKALSMDARLRKMTLRQLLGNIQLKF